MIRPVVVAAVVLALSAPAHAGNLAKVVNGLKQRSGQTSSSNQGKAAPDKSSDDSSNSSSSTSDSGGSNIGWGGGSGGAYTPTPVLMGGQPYPTSTMGSDIQMYFALMSVVESEGAMRGSVRASSGRWGVGLDGTRYFEQTMTAQGKQYLHLDVWSLTGAYRALRMGKNSRTAVWLQAGLAGQASDGLHLLGATLGAEIAHNVNSAVGVEASARVFAMQDSIRAMEVRAGVAASVLRVSYRVLKFNVGPALRGPEVGLALRF